MWKRFLVKRLRSGYTSKCIYKLKKVSNLQLTPWTCDASVARRVVRAPGLFL